MSRLKELVPVGTDASGQTVYKWVTGKDKQSFFSNFAKAYRNITYRQRQMYALQSGHEQYSGITL